MSRETNKVRKAFGLLFVAISISVAIAAVISELILMYKGSVIYYAIAWFSSVSVALGLLFYRSPGIVGDLRGRFKESTGWPSIMKAVNGISWAMPFALIPLFPMYYAYLVLLGIGLGNISTYLVFRHMRAFAFREQLMIGIMVLATVPMLFALKSLNAASDDVLMLILRLSIAAAYGVGGTYALHFDQ